MSRAIDADALAVWLREVITRKHRRKGAVVAVSGGIDSTVTVHLVARALGARNVIGLYLPEAATAPETSRYVQLATEGVCDLKTVDLTSMLEAAGCYRQLDAVLRSIDVSWSCRTHHFALVLDAAFARRTGSLRYRLRVRPADEPNASCIDVSLRSTALAELIAANNLKQRLRMVATYNEAEKHRWAVIGTSNADELDFGFVVKYGDHSGDVQPLGNLYKSEVYALASQLGVPGEIVLRTPTTDTFSLEQSQDEYYYAVQPADMRRLLGQAAGATRGPNHDLALRLRRSGALLTLEPTRFDVPVSTTTEVR